MQFYRKFFKVDDNTERELARLSASWNKLAGAASTVVRASYYGFVRRDRERAAHILEEGQIYFMD